MSRFAVALVCAACLLGCSGDRQAREQIRKVTRRRTGELQRQARLDRDEDRAAENYDGADFAGTVLSNAASSFQRASFDSANLADAKLNGSFQLASFVNADLSGAELAGSFQCACFDNASLVNATLSGEGSSFQAASFVAADLSGASIKGNFQCARFAGAKLVGATVLDSGGPAFQGMDIDGSWFEGADLSKITRRTLESCFFGTPPSYDEETRFPQGFNPRRQGWTSRRAQ
ncbi:MAG: pentapeptide repeat-containing protein [Lentisphaerae bacterium]|jgi:uncharacterized protein YjbI with pentapeptide repeats|nr:pentapeptide repeat-containing protein [Lentisphaerota bacterium]MBT4816286.1 pentapeptide repeat-containing protein [Lentisphaerota bacterium]MBT5610922.1 pentapeptide repeat-containing protein [Lentisphaerota bacterium]MBT7053437.1 pentapeptide repeat-containing protein [Lentisphaerota bacterium]MBT7840705.1 pentapeptide repeat-containing protein [Lentisphaerota bacterium]